MAIKRIRGFQLMKENHSWVKVWEHKGKEHCFWTNGQVAFSDVEFMHYPPGYYIYREKTLMPIPENEAPTKSWKDLIFSSIGMEDNYEKAQIPYLDESETYLNILYSIDGKQPDLLKLKNDKTIVYIKANYYFYAIRWLVSNWTQFKVRDNNSPVIVYSEGRIRGLIMPYQL